MKVHTNTAPLARMAARLREIGEGLGRTWTVSLDLPAEPRDPYPTLRPRKGPAPVQPTNATVALVQPWLTAQTDVSRARLYEALRDAWARGIQHGGQLMLVAGQAWKRVAVERSQGSLTDSHPDTNTAAWRERKGRLGLDTASGRASGQLARALEASNPIARKVA